MQSKRILSAVLAAAVSFSCLALPGCGKQEEPVTTETTETATAAVEEIRNPLTGEAGYDKNALTKRPVAVMINNAPGARPQWGLCTPDIVFEGLIEAGTSRMMWVYANPDDIPEKIGSIRSARHDFIELAESLDAIYVHWGGSVYAYDALKERGVDDIDGRYLSTKYAHRDETRDTAIENRGYMIGDEIRELIAKKGYRTELETKNNHPFAFNTDGSYIPAGEQCSEITASFSAPYSHTFRYNEQDKLYYNFMKQTPMTQDGGRQMAVKNVVILFTPIEIYNDGAGCVNMDLTGGSGLFVSNGRVEKITWKKGNNPTDPLKLFNADGGDLTLNSGKSWIGLIPASREDKVIINTAKENTSVISE